MATNLAIDPALLNHAVEALGVKTKREAVVIALQEAIVRREQRKLLDLEGAVEWVPGYDYKVDRAARSAVVSSSSASASPCVPIEASRWILRKPAAT